MIPEHFVALVVVVCVTWIFIRWGALIFLAYAVWHLWFGEWTLAGLALCFACTIEALRAPMRLIASAMLISTVSRASS